MGLILRRKVGDSQRTLDLSGWSSDITVDRTMSGTSTLTITISDPEWLTATSGYFDLDEDGKFSNIWFMWYGNQYSLVQMTPNDTETVLTFEDAAIHELKQQFGHKTQRRKEGYTRAMFIKQLIDEANTNTQNDQIFIKFYAPDLNKDKRIAKPDIPDTTPNQPNKSDIQFKDDKQNPGDKGISTHERKALLRKWGNNKAGGPLSHYRLDIAERVLKVCDDHNAKEIVKISMIFAAWAESKIDPAAAPNSAGYMGLFGWKYGHGNGRAFVERPAKYWLIGGYGFQGGGGIQVARDYPHAQVREIAQRVEGIWNPSAGHGQYEAENGFSYFLPLAQDIVTAYDGGGVDNSGGVKNKGNIKQTYKEKAYHFERNKGESSWACIKRLAQEVNWAVWCEGQTVHFMTQEDIYLQKPRRVVNRESSHILSFEFDWDEGKYISTCKAGFLSDHWKVPPGHNVEVVGAGPADGRWLVNDVTREGEQDDSAPPGGIVTVTLETISAPRLEPAPEVTSGSKGGKKNSDIQFKKGFKGGKRPGGNWKYGALIDKTAQMEGNDQGVDFTTETSGKTADVYAIGDGTIVRADYNSGWPGTRHTMICLRLRNRVRGRSHGISGKYVYYAEGGLKKRVRVGQKVVRGQRVATLDASTIFCEIGWAQDGHGTAYGSSSDGHGGAYPVYGADFDRYVQELSK